MPNHTVVESVCQVCESIFTASRASKYCGRKCRDRGRVVNAGMRCSGCAEPVFPRPGAAQGEMTCRSCRALRHGTTTTYKRGCRCEVCTAAKAADSASFAAKKRAEFGVAYSTVTRRRFREANGYWPNPRGGDWIHSRVRLELYERDRWTCYLCEKPVDRDGDPNGNHAPSLDHLIPRSAGGSDDPSNLKTACRSCNSRKGARLDYAA